MSIENKKLDGWTSIHSAAFFNDYNTLLNELNSGTDPNLISKNFNSGGYSNTFFRKKIIIIWNNMTPLYLAAFKGNSKCVKLLMSRGADPSIKSYNTYYKSYTNPISVASSYFNYKCIRLMKKQYTNCLLSNEQLINC